MVQQYSPEDLFNTEYSLDEIINDNINTTAEEEITEDIYDKEVEETYNKYDEYAEIDEKEKNSLHKKLNQI